MSKDKVSHPSFGVEVATYSHTDLLTLLNKLQYNYPSISFKEIITDSKESWYDVWLQAGISLNIPSNPLFGKVCIVDGEDYVVTDLNGVDTLEAIEQFVKLVKGNK